MTVLSPADRKYVRSFGVDRMDVAFIATPQGRLLWPGVSYSPKTGMKKFVARRISWDGRTETPIAASHPQDRFGRMVAADSGRVWISDSRTYTLTLYDGNRAVRTIRRKPDWFPEDTTPIRTIGTRPFVAGIGTDERGNLLVFIRRPNPGWKGQAKITRPITPSQFPPVGEVYVGTIEALDPITGALLASRDVPGDMIAFIGPGRLYQRTEADSSGALMFKVWRVSLRPPD
jgi:hypothetical protein